jgi:hypothetical protein
MNTIEIIFQFAVFLHVITGLVTLAFVIPLQVKEAGVKNGLAKLRKMLLLRGVLGLGVIAISVFALMARSFFDGDALRNAVVIFVLTHAIGLLLKTLIDYQIYHQQYTPESKELHKKIEVIEKKREELKNAEK